MGNKTVLAMGFFDGLHIGHGELLKTAKMRAEGLGAKSAVLTFDAHPDLFVKREKIDLINSAADRVYIINRFYDIDNVYFLHFNEDTMRMDWRVFAEDIIEAYGVCHFVVGHDFRFGYKGEGTAEKLRTLCRDSGIGCNIIPAVSLDGETVSSTLIRSLLADGEIERANRLLGHPHLLTGTVRTGHRLGRTMGAPTINMKFAEGVLIPRHGVYAAKARFEGAEHIAVLNIGYRPTFYGDEVTVETNILDFEGDLYGKTVCVELYHYIRPERRFPSAQELMVQIKRDSADARAFFSGK